MTLPESQTRIGSTPKPPAPRPAAEASPGTTASPEGPMASPDGAMASPEGAMASPDGAMASTAGSAARALPPSDADLIAAIKASPATGSGQAAGASQSGQASSAGKTSPADACARLDARHAAAARRLAGLLVRGQAEAGEVVEETLGKLLDLLRRGGGPEDAFRPYLLIAVRRTAYDWRRAERRQVLPDDYGLFDFDAPFADPAVAGSERSMIVRAYLSLPARSQAVLWHTAIEGERPAEVAELLGVTASGVAPMAYRARESLRQAYLQMHLSGVARAGCRPVAGKLGTYGRGGLSKRDAATVTAHLGQCEECRTILADLPAVGVALKPISGPLVLGAAATGYLGPDTPGGWLAGRAARFRRAPRGQ